MIIHDLEQGSEEWRQLRAGIPTGSEFKRLATGTGVASTGLDAYALELAVGKIAGLNPDGFQGNKYTDRGEEFEEQAVHAYEFTKGIEVKTVGFISDDLVTHGVSPDGLVGKDGSIEVKSLTAVEWAKAALYYIANGDCEPGYKPQTQGLMLVAQRQWCDWIAYHPSFPILIIRQTPDDRIQDLLKEQIENVIILRNLFIKQLNSI